MRPGRGDSRRDLPPRVVDGPDWVNSTRYDIVAKADGSTSPEQLRLMQQTLLRERFNLSLRRERRGVQGYSLVLARSDKRLGPRLQAAAIDCGSPTARGAAPEFAAGTQRPSCGVRTTPTSFRGGGIALTRLVETLAQATGAPVTDPPGNAAPSAPAPEGAGRLAATAGPAADVDGPSIYTAVQEQLGLRLQPGRTAVDVLVIERADRPTEN